LSAAAVMDLWLGPAADQPPAFASDDERRALWLRHRDELMNWYGGHGHRPMAWWRYYSGDIRFPGPDRERSTLFEAGVLSERERVELVKDWRVEFDRAHAPDFFLCEGPGRFLYGAAARCAHFEWADIPCALVDDWTAARCRSAETIRALTEDGGGDA
jgi:hypothetical protein